MNTFEKDIERRQTFSNRIWNFVGFQGEQQTWKNLNPGAKPTPECYEEVLRTIEQEKVEERSEITDHN